MVWGLGIQAEDGSVAIGRDNRAPVSIVNGIPPGQVTELVRLAVSGRPGDYTELLRRLDAMIPADSRMRAEALARFFAALGETEVPPEDLTERLVEIARRYQALLTQLESTSSTDLEVQRLKTEAREALDLGDFGRTEELLNRAKTRDLLAIEQMRAAMELLQADLDARQLSAAEAAAENGALMMTQLRYADAARYFAEAGELTPETHPVPLSGQLASWAEAAWYAGDYRTAVNAGSRALALDEAQSLTDDTQLGLRVNNLAVFYQALGRYAEAEPLYKRALVIREKALGSEHPDVAQSLNNLAMLCQLTDRYAEAEPLLRRALVIREKTLGSEHPDVAQSLNNLAMLCQLTDRHAEAEPLYQRAIAIGKKALGNEHPDFATWFNNLAKLYDDTGRYAEAEPLYQRALSIQEKTLGPEHPYVAHPLYNLAMLYSNTGRYAEAGPLLRRAVAINEKAGGREHSYGAHPRRNLHQASDHSYTKAERNHQLALVMREKALGSEHPDLAYPLHNLAVFYKALGRYAEAEPLYERALVIREKALGPEHPHVAQSLNNLAIHYYDTGHYAKAEPLLRRALVILKKTFPPEHPDLAQVRKNYSKLVDQLGHSKATFADRADGGLGLAAIQQFSINPFNRIGRNTTCPCGSGKKFKNCHLSRL